MLVKKSTRRKFLTNLSSGLFLIAGAALFAAPEKPLLNQKFKMKFAPRGLFRASTKGDKFAYIKWLAEHGFTAVEGVVFLQSQKSIFERGRGIASPHWAGSARSRIAYEQYKLNE